MISNSLQKASCYPLRKSSKPNNVEAYEKHGNIDDPKNDRTVSDVVPATGSGNPAGECSAIGSPDFYEKPFVTALGIDSHQMALLRTLIRIVMGEYATKNQPATFPMIMDGELNKLANGGGGAGESTVYTVNYQWAEAENAVLKEEYILWTQLQYAQHCRKNLADWVYRSDYKYPSK